MTARIDLTAAQVRAFRKTCGITSRGPECGYLIRYDIAGHGAPFAIANYSNQVHLPPFAVFYSENDEVTAMLLRNLTTGPQS